MDRITKSLLDEFATEHALQDIPEDQQFEHFATYLAVSRHHGDAFDTADVLTGAGGDTGIDAIGVIVNGTLVTDAEMVEELAKTNGFLEVTFVFVQAKRSPTFESAKIGQLISSMPCLSPRITWTRPIDARTTTSPDRYLLASNACRAAS